MHTHAHACMPSCLPPPLHSSVCPPARFVFRLHTSSRSPPLFFAFVRGVVTCLDACGLALLCCAVLARRFVSVGVHPTWPAGETCHILDLCRVSTVLCAREAFKRIFAPIVAESAAREQGARGDEAPAAHGHQQQRRQQQQQQQSVLPWLLRVIVFDPFLSSSSSPPSSFSSSSCAASFSPPTSLPASASSPPPSTTPPRPPQQQQQQQQQEPSQLETATMAKTPPQGSCRVRSVRARGQAVQLLEWSDVADPARHLHACAAEPQADAEAEAEAAAQNAAPRKPSAGGGGSGSESRDSHMHAHAHAHAAACRSLFGLRVGSPVRLDSAAAGPARAGGGGGARCSPPVPAAPAAESAHFAAAAAAAVSAARGAAFERAQPFLRPSLLLLPGVPASTFELPFVAARVWSVGADDDENDDDDDGPAAFAAAAAAGRRSVVHGGGETTAVLKRRFRIPVLPALRRYDSTPAPSSSSSSPSSSSSSSSSSSAPLYAVERMQRPVDADICCEHEEWAFFSLMMSSGSTGTPKGSPSA
jgi:hypothetical protein